MDADSTALSFAPVRVVPKAVYANSLKATLRGKPCFRPETLGIGAFAPGLPRASTESVYEDEVHEMTRRFV